MKKLISVLLALISVICIAFFFVGCGNDKATEKSDISPVTDTSKNPDNDKQLEAGKLYTLAEAYEGGYLTLEDLMSIAEINNMQTRCTETLDSQIELLIKTCEVKKLQKTGFPEANIEGVLITKFFGKFSDCYVVVIRNFYELHPTDVPDRSFYVDGVYFQLHSYANIVAWSMNN